MNDGTYVSLHLHSYYSLLDGLVDPADYAKRAKEWGMPAIAITDHGTLAGIPDFFLACQAEGVKPILGIEAYMVPDRHARKTFKAPSGKEIRTGYHLVLLAKNLTGYHNLITLNNLANTEGYYYSPKIDWEILTKYREGLIVSSACVAGEVGQTCLSSESPKKVIAKFKEIWGEDYYLELMDNNMSNDVQRIVNKRLIELSKPTGVKLIPTNDSHYLDAEMQKMHDIAICMKSQKLLSDTKRLKYDGIYHMKSVPEMHRLFGEYMRNTIEVADKVEAFDILTKDIKLPVIVADPDKVLRMMTTAALCAKGLNKSPYTERLNFELDVIARKGFSAYMLTIKEVIDLIYANDCPIGWGRGSAGGSLICYVLNITSVDPIQYNLLFERFISEFRPDWPDIDIDISRDMRDEIIRKIMDKYGTDKVSHISTVHYMKPKILVRDICRVAEKPTAMADALSKMVPKDAEDIDDLKGTDMERQLLKSVDGKAIWDCLGGLLGVPRHVGMHASGIVISPEPIINSLPIRKDQDNTLIIQYSMEHLDKFGFLKFDLLGVETLDLVFETAKEVGINIKDIPLDDAKTYAAIGEGKVAGLFQLDKSKTCMEICKRMKPQNIQDLADIIALNRPGVLDAGLLDVYLGRRDGTDPISFIHPELKAILGRTYGVCIYQEDLMRMAKIYAGYTPLEVENLRKGVGKKDEKIIAHHLTMFKEKALALGRAPEEVDKVLEQIEAAQRYSFNHCLARDTMILTPRGNVSINKLNKGQPVYSVDDAGQVVVQPIKCVHINGVQDVYKITLSNGMTAKATQTHKFLGSNGYKAVSELRAGDVLKTFGNNLPVGTIDRHFNDAHVMSIKYIGKEMTYDLEMPQYHNFIANGIVSHNSHAVAYAMLTYACGYLATNHPLHFFKNLINHADEATRADYISHTLLRGIKILPPDINRSSGVMTVEEAGIRWGLVIIKGIGDVAVGKIMEGRPYKGMKDVTTKLGKSIVAILHAVHALDSLPDVKSYTPIGKMDEVILLGVPLSGMLNEYQDIVDFIHAAPVADLQEEGGGRCVIKITDIVKRPDKNDRMMAFMEGFDVFGPKISSLLMFASDYENFGKDLKKGEVYGMVVARSNRGGYIMKGINSAANIRVKIAAKKGT